MIHVLYHQSVMVIDLKSIYLRGHTLTLNF